MTTVFDYTVRNTSPVEFAERMPYITSSMVEAILTCPKWGLIRNVQHKSFVTGFRQMALEAGSLMHEVFSVYNLWQLAKTQGLMDHAIIKGNELFSKSRFQTGISFNTILAKDYDDDITLEKLAINTIATSDYFDDPNDKKRTLANIEFVAYELARYFLLNHVNFNIFVADRGDPTSYVGIEHSMDVIFEATLTTGEVKKIRFIGLADVVYQNKETKRVTLGEYKTTSSMNDGWRDAFKTRHQLSAYNGALEAAFDNVSFKTILTGSTIPVPKTTVSVQHFVVDRDREWTKRFLEAALFATEIMQRWPDQSAVYAPMFTHSCNRYFRPCSFIDLCHSDLIDQLVMWEQMEVQEELSPSEMRALLRNEN